MTVPSQELQAKIDEWVRWDKNANTSGVIRRLTTERKFDVLKAILLKRITFGTAGLRGRMAAGYTYMNDLVIIQTGQGLLRFLEHHRTELLEKNGIVIGFDGRHDSERWARMTGAIFSIAGYKTRLARFVHPTPFIPFAIRTFNLAAGVMVTASHNPKDDNGYKVYDSNSAQIVSPVDEQIQQFILENLEPLPGPWENWRYRSNPLILNYQEEITELYIKKVILDKINPDEIETNARVGLSCVYTAMHGVAWPTVEKVAEAVKGNLFSVPEQQDAHADFPTVKFPNPEEGKSALELAFKHAKERGCQVVLANDPDADRFAVAERNLRTERWHIFNGNELGALLGWWMLECHKKNNPDIPLDKVYMIASTVSSKILQTMAKVEEFNFVETLTGFKWIGNKALELEKEGYTVIFCFEEAIGYMCNNIIVDKDGVSALAHFIGLANFVYGGGKRLLDQLIEIYDIYGLHLTRNSYFYCRDPKVIKKIFERLRNMNGPETYPTGALEGKHQVISVRDLTTGYDSAQPDNRAILPVCSNTQMITFVFDNDLEITLRTSGTEPKIKYYSELRLSPEFKDRIDAIETLREMVEDICDEFLQPTKNGLLPQGTMPPPPSDSD